MGGLPNMRTGVQAVLALGLTGAVIYLTIVGKMDTDIVAALAGTAIAFFLAEQKNGKERAHTEEMALIRSGQSRRVD